MDNLTIARRSLLMAPLLAALPIAGAGAAGVDPGMTIVVPPDRIPWAPLYDFPTNSAEQAKMFGDIAQPGQYFVLIRWQPGFMSAPHWYETTGCAWSSPASGGWRAARTSPRRAPSRRRWAPSSAGSPARRTTTA